MSVLNLSWGLPALDRLNKVHRVARVELPQSVTAVLSKDREAVRTLHIKPGVAYLLAIAGFMTCGGIIIAACGFLAIYVQ